MSTAVEREEKKKKKKGDKADNNKREITPITGRGVGATRDHGKV